MNRQPYVERYASEEISCELQMLTCCELGFVQRLRDYSWINNGIPSDEESLKRIAKACQFSLYHLKKSWPFLRKIFIEFEGMLYYERDEERRFQSIERSDKCSVLGKLGAEARRKKNGYRFASVPEMGNGQAIFSDGHPRQAAGGFSSTTTQKENHQPPPPTPSESQPVILTLETLPDIAEGEFEAIRQKTIGLNLSPPGRALCGELRRIFTGYTFEFMIDNLVRFPNQVSTGLWLHKSAKDFIEEHVMQSTPIPRKPSATTEAWADFLEEGRERDRQRAAKA